MTPQPRDRVRDDVRDRPRGRERREPAASLVLSAVLSLALAAAMIVSLAVGPADISVGEIARSIAAHLWGADGLDSPTRDAIIWELRLPRVVSAAFVGAGLALCGAVLQATTRNPLADPYLLGLSSGASLGAVLVIVAGMSIVLPLAAFVGAIFALAATLLLASASGPPTPSRTVLAGVAVSAALSAGTSTVIFWSATGDSYREILGWLMGSLAGSTWLGVAVVAASFVVVGLPLAMSATVLDAFAFGDRTAMSLGVDVGRARVALLVGSALLTGALVSISGCIGFIGLLVPHAARMVVGHRHRVLLPVSALGGALLLVLADAVARTAFAPRELPVGIVTALVGAPAFALLLLRSPRASS